MIQKTIRDWGGVEFTTTEGAEQQTEWNDRTVYAVDGYNSIAELGVATQAIEVKTDFITVTQAVDLDTIESDTATNNSKVSYTDAAQVATNKTNADASKVITDFISITQAVDLDTVESDTTTNNAKITYPSADSTKVGHISVTQAVNLDTIESDTNTNNAKVTYDDAAQVATNKTNADASKVITDFITVTQAVDLDTMESGIATNVSDITDRLKSVTTAEPTGSDVLGNAVSLTQAEYNAGTPVATTLYYITDA